MSPWWKCGLLMMGIAVWGCSPVPPGNDNTNDNTNQNENQNENMNENGDTNQAPTADAGTNQTVDAGDTVQLDGSGSSDPDGDSLSFTWSQTGGTAVTLSDANTDMPSFTAPSENVTLTFELEVDDGESTDTDTVSVTIVVPTVTQLYIADFAGDRVVSYEDPATVNGNIVPDTNLQGSQTDLNRPADIVVNNASELIAANFNTPSITVYEDAPGTNGNIEPDGNVQGAATEFTAPTSLAINTAEDLLFVADITNNEIYVYEDTAATTFNGNVAPIRTIATTTTADLNDPTGINFGAGDELYVANRGGSNILVFANASNLNGDVSPSRIITSAAFTTVFDVFIDDNDNMFVVDTSGDIFTFNDASSLNGNQDPDFTLTVPGAGLLSAIAVDSNGVGYIVDNTNAAVYSYNNVANRNGTINPDRTIQGANTQLVNPIRVFLVE